MPRGRYLKQFIAAFWYSATALAAESDLAKPALVVIMTWLGAGGTVLIYLSGLREIPLELYEAAELDGFSVFKRIWYITLPHISGRIKNYAGIADNFCVAGIY